MAWRTLFLVIVFAFVLGGLAWNIYRITVVYRHQPAERTATEMQLSLIPISAAVPACHADNHGRVPAEDANQEEPQGACHRGSLESHCQSADGRVQMCIRDRPNAVWQLRCGRKPCEVPSK